MRKFKIERAKQTIIEKYGKRLAMVSLLMMATLIAAILSKETRERTTFNQFFVMLNLVRFNNHLKRFACIRHKSETLPCLLEA